ncbi:hypothetical protein POM88_048877 [Heracleum sosnowskyi]|uniref:Uncharacterized protein n=1 Tax=Heracleum sosnowskyi TaxID=360622 RepID=A0AAD8M018_9APIA|nr:hypothetical protein POM88_048877 [Heracleum sosnowskyi]
MLEFLRASSRAKIKSLKLPFKGDEFGQWVADNFGQWRTLSVTESACGLFFFFGEPTETSNLVKVLCSLQRIENIYVAVEFIEYLAAGWSPNKLPKPLPHLKTLEISDMNFLELDVISFLLCWIRSAPNLCKLNISANFCCLDFSYYDDYLEYCRGFSICRLEIVKPSHFRGLRAE